MKIFRSFLTLVAALAGAGLLAGCSSSGYSSGGGVSIYSGYHYPHYGFDYGWGYYPPPPDRPNRPPGNRPPGNRPPGKPPAHKPPPSSGPTLPVIRPPSRPPGRPSGPIGRPQPMPRSGRR